ncbi:hypothetical protein [Muribaculum intestinale]|uniref:hypothetical protein n=1 Tax=Muribaculum intestinale TaxID=1796646 RepID=UPI0025B76265|nr:hypothetical protein [Muribaculum intestinale]
MENDNPTVQSEPVTAPATGYKNGSDMLLSLDGKCIGHCTSHKIQYGSDTKSHNVKAPESEAATGSALFTEETVTGLNYQIDFEGLEHNEETENSAGLIRKAWRAAKPVEVKLFERGKKETPYLVGYCIISSLSEDYPAADDTSFSGSLKNCGAPSVFTA